MGGLLADAMGIGKTIQSIAIMCLNPPPPPPDDGSKYKRGDYPQTTLVVAPVALLDQWKDEIETHCRRNTFKVHIYHGKGKDSIKTARDLEQMDVVLCTYQAVMRSYPPKPKNRKSMTKDEYDKWFNDAWDRRGIFHRVRFWRVILDESHIIKNRLGQIFMACQELEAENTWALTGTPFVNRLSDVLPVLKFIHHPSAGTYEQFKALGCESNNQRGAQRVQAILRKYMMRRTKRDYLMGKPIITLPKKRLNNEERALYEAVRMHAVTKINKYVEEGTEMKHFSTILTMLLRLRQVCDHPYLIRPQQRTTTDDDDDKKPSQLRRIMQACKRQKPIGEITHCPRCQGPIEDPVIVKKCRHVFCRECLTTAMAEESHCPYNNGACGQRLHEGDYTSFNETTKKEEFDIDDDSTWLDRADLMKDFQHSTKTIALRNQLREWRRNHPNDKIVLFSQFTMMLDIVEKVVDDDEWLYTRYQGGMTMGARQEALAEFRNNGECKIMLTSIKAGGVGLNLTHANLVISLDLWWNAAVELQAFDRVHRLGQKKEVFITRFMVKDSVEEKMLELQQKKLGLAKAALGEGQLALGKLTRDELLGLFVSFLYTYVLVMSDY
ncbi:hypothetical protein K440DRAFT_533033 [Wilcoxina mikolae CBS 423.85]|nr:hypothetical protein K440DRAFT_533033 [Wilcoxina mikolae CBS 423.85]